MKNILSITAVAATIAALTLLLNACGSNSGSDSTVGADYAELMQGAKVVNTAEDRASCTEDSINSLYFVRSNNSFSTCVNQGGALGHGYVDVNIDKSQYDGATDVLSFYRYRRLPYCGYWRRGLVVFVHTTKELKYCGKKRGYRWWYVWRDVNIDTSGAGSACTVKDNGDGSKTIDCGNSSAKVYDGKDGQDGAPGAKGADGKPGADGQPGAKGPLGDVGPQGNQGPQGPAGKDGANGPQGPAGDQGPAGPQGPAGSDGSPGEQGDSGAPGKDGPVGPKGDPGTTPGPRGPAGQQGDTGPQGQKGPPGTKGDTGPRGGDGDDGRSCTLTTRPDGKHEINCPNAEPIIFEMPIQ